MPLSRPFQVSVLVALAALPSAASQAQTNRFPQLWSPDGLVEGIAVLGDTVFVGGRFRQVGPSTGQLAVLDKTTGEADLAWPRFESVNLGALGIAAIAPDGAGGFFAGGGFGWVSGQRRLNLARVRPDGTLDPAFRPDPIFVNVVGDTLGAVFALDPSAASPSGAGILYVGGAFDRVGGQDRQALAALDAGTGAVLPLSVDFADSFSTPAVSDLVVRNGVLYLGGTFETVGGVPRTVAAVDWAAFPALDDLFVYNRNGVMAGRTWPIAPDADTLTQRWRRLRDERDLATREELFHPHEGGDRTVLKQDRTAGIQDHTPRSISVAEDAGEVIPPVRYAFRSLDRQYLIPDKRLINRENPVLWNAHSARQVYLTAPNDKSPTDGPALSFSAAIPDAHHYNGRGGRVYPLWRDSRL